MVVLLAVLTVVALIALDYLVLRKRRANQPVEIRLPGLEPLSHMIDQVPDGVFLQPTYTWTRIREDGDLLIGVHPLLLGLLGAPYRFELLGNGSAVEKGMPLIGLERNERRLSVPSPVDGRVTAVNRRSTGETQWKGLEAPDGSWLYRIRPARVQQEVRGWMIADAAVAWTKQQYEGIRDYLTRVAGLGEVGVTMADGGDVPIGVLASLDDAGWNGFQDTFLSM
jgi:glycine cleavage system H lipoate-binding protein